MTQVTFLFISFMLHLKSGGARHVAGDRQVGRPELRYQWDPA
jgi:hypothetical protein